MAVKTEQIDWPNFSELLYVSVPLEDDILPHGVKVPDYARYVQHAVYLGPRQKVRHFWEEQRVLPTVVGTKVSHDDYLEELDKVGVPLPPSKNRWSRPHVLWTANLHAQSEISFTGEDASQARVTTIARSTPPEVPHETFLFWNQTTDRLAQFGLGRTDFDYWREDGRFIRERSKTLQRPIIGRIAEKILVPFNTGLNIMDLRANPEGYMINIVRTRRA